MATDGVKKGDLVGLLTAARATVLTARGSEYEPTLKWPNYPGCAMVKKRKKESMGGPDFTWTMRGRDTGTARMTRAYQKDSVNQIDTGLRFTTDWRHWDDFWLFDEREEMQNGGELGAEKLYTLVKMREEQVDENMGNLLEPQVFYPPTNSADDKNIHGLLYHLRPGPSGTYTPGFVGTNVRWLDGSTAGQAVWCGQDRSVADAERTRNYAATYDKINETFIRGVEQMLYNCSFNPPFTMNVQDLGDIEAALYVPYNVKREMATLMDAKNQNFGRKLSMGNGSVLMFENTPVIPTPVLDKTSDSDTHAVRALEPVIVVDWRRTEFRYHPKRWFKATTKLASDSHNTVENWKDCSGQLIVRNPRHAGGVMHKTY
jgi:hypothetical protein